MAHKLHNPKSHAPAVYIPCWLIQVPNKLLSYAAKVLYGRLAQWSNENGDVFRSYNQLAEEIGSTQRSVNEYLRELRECGLIGTLQPQAGGLNHFVFYDHEWMYEPINEFLCYKIEHDPKQNPALPQAESCSTPKQNPARINIKEIKENNKDIVTDVPDSPKPTKFEELKPYVEVWNKLAVPIGCPAIGVNQKQLLAVKRNFKEIKKQWNRKMTPKNFEVWLDDAIFHEFYLICKYKKSMDVCVRPEHFLDAYNHVMETSAR